MSAKKYLIKQKKSSKEELVKLKEELDKSKRPGDIVWTDSFKSNSEEFTLQREIEDILIGNNLEYERFPSDYTHGLLCLNFYEVQTIEDWTVEMERENLYKNTKIVLSKSRVYVNKLQKKMVVAYSGFLPDMFQFLTDSGDHEADFKSIISTQIIPQLTDCFELVSEASSKANSEEFNLSFTGFSSGAWLAEYSLYFYHKYLNFPNSKAVLFQSPGSIGVSMVKEEAKREHLTKDSSLKNIVDFDFNELDIINYLDSPSLANGLSQVQSGTVIRLLTPSDDKEEESVENMLKNLLVRGARYPGPMIYNRIESNRFLVRGLYALIFGKEVLKKMIGSIANESIESMEKVVKWPQIKFDSAIKLNLKTDEKETDFITEFIQNSDELLRNKCIPSIYFVFTVLYKYAKKSIDLQCDFKSANLFDLTIKDKVSRKQESLEYETIYYNKYKEELDAEPALWSATWYLTKLKKNSIYTYCASRIQGHCLRSIKDLYTIEEQNISQYIRMHNKKKSKKWTIRKLYEILDLIIELNPKINCLVIDKQTEILNDKLLKRLKKDLERNKYPGDIIWPSHDWNENELKLVSDVENLIIGNNLKKRIFPSDFMHSLFCLNINRNENKLDKIHEQDPNWIVLKTFKTHIGNG